MKYSRFISFLSFFFSLASLRLLIVRHFEINWTRAYQQGLISGLILDISIALKLRRYQRTLLWPRTIMGVVTKNLKPKVISYPVHQIDIAPMIANIAGIQGDVTWLGRSPLKQPGTPWVKKSNNMVSYRTQDRICIETSKKVARCWKTKLEEDPLLLSNLEEVEDDLSLADDLKEVIQANEAWLDAGGT